jgi:hypothetical protein
MAWLWAIPLNGVLVVGAYLIARHALRQAAGLPRTLGAVVVGWTWATVGVDALGSFGLIAPGPLLVWSGVLLAAGLAARVLDRSSRARAEPRSDHERWGWESVVALGLVFWTGLVRGAQSLLFPVKVVSDGPIYHLYFAARWWKAGRIFLIATPFGENAATYFPAVGDVWFTWLFVSWGGDRLARIGQAPFLVVAALTSFALARRLGAGRSASAVATCWFVTATPFLLFSFEPNVDTIFVVGYLLAAYFFLRFALNDDREPALVLGALAAGGALGSKAIGVVFVPVLLVLAIAASLRRPASAGRKALSLALVLGLPLIMAGPWYARNAVLTGNPLYPLQVSAFGRVLLPGWYDRNAMQLSKYYLPVSDLRVFWDIVLSVFDPRLVPLWLAALLGAWAFGPRRSSSPRFVWAAAVLAAVNVAQYWLLIPYRTQQRFMLQAVGLAAVPLAMLLDRSRLLRRLGLVLLAVHLLTAQNWPFESWANAPWDLSPLVPSKIDPPLPVRAVASRLMERSSVPGLRIAAGATLCLGLAATAMAWAWLRVTVARTRASIIAAAATSTVAIALAAVAVWPFNADEKQTFFPPFPDYYAGWLALDARSGPAGARVAYAGTNLPYYLLGVGLRNDVRYINVDAHRDWLLHDYHRAARLRGSPNWPDTRPGWDRMHADYEAWLANLRAARIQMLVVARANPDEGPHNLADRSWFPIERVWADAHPETFQPLYGVAENDPQFRLYRVIPPGDHPL